MQELRQKLEDIKTVVVAKQRELKSLKEKIAAERINFSPNKIKIAKIQSLINRIKNELEVALPKLQREIEVKIRKKIKEEKAKPQLIEEQKKIIRELKKSCSELLTILENAEIINAKIVDLNFKCSQLESKTKMTDRKNCSGGFRSLSILRNVLENEIAGKGRKLVFWPRQFRL